MQYEQAMQQRKGNALMAEVVKRVGHVRVLDGVTVSRGYTVERVERRGEGVWFLGTQIATGQRGWYFSH
jgi:hypothetical protein